jgi:hypothetical protein
MYYRAIGEVALADFGPSFFSVNDSKLQILIRNIFQNSKFKLN